MSDIVEKKIVFLRLRLSGKASLKEVRGVSQYNRNIDGERLRDVHYRQED